MLHKQIVEKWMLFSILTQSFWVIVAILDIEAPMTSSGMEGDWMISTDLVEEVISDARSGCLCRTQHTSMVCYGSIPCTEFPIDVNMLATTKLHLKTTAIQVLKFGDFQFLTEIANMEIEANHRLDKVEEFVFHKMAKLTNLSISFNTNLKKLYPDTFVGLDKLERLRMIKNGFTKILDAIAPLTHTPNLEILILSQNSFKLVDQEDFVILNGSKIRELNLILCQIEKIHPAALSPFKYLSKLRIGGNLVNESNVENLIETMTKENIPLALLNLRDLGLRKEKVTDLLMKISNLHVSHLVLSKNHLESLNVGLFPEMKYLKILDLRETTLLRIQQNSLNQKVMPNLEVLFLGGNQLSDFNPISQLPNLLQLDLSENSGSQKFPSYFDVSSGSKFRNMTKLTTLVLSYNKITTILNHTFDGLFNLKVLELKNSSLFFIEENSFQILKKLKFLNLEDNPFPPFNKFRKDIFSGLHNLESLLLSGCKISVFLNPNIFKPLVNLTFLYLDDNNFKTIDSRIFSPLSKLYGLDLSNNLLIPWKSGNLLTNNINITVLKLSNNQLTYITQTMLNDFTYVQRLDLSCNPFICDCSSFNITMSWLVSKNLTVNETNLMNPSHVCVSPDAWRYRTITDFISDLEQGYCLSDVDTSIFYLFLLPPTILLIICICAFLIYKYRWYIRYWSFKSQINTLKESKHMNTIIESKYDAFVSYSHEDRLFVIRLVAMLENYEPFLKLCVYERDFLIGTVISETVMNSISASKRTILIVSDSFAKSQWCMWEMHIAEHYKVFFNNSLDSSDSCSKNPLIIIKLGPINKAHMTPMLKYLLRTRIFLEWDADCEKQQIFWKKLRSTLSRS